jgi:hypothetical protein
MSKLVVPVLPLVLAAVGCAAIHMAAGTGTTWRDVVGAGRPGC